MKTILCLLGILTANLLLASEVSAVEQEIQIYYPFFWPVMASRKPFQVSCYVSYRIDELKFLCISKKLFQSLLNESKGFPGNALWEGKWKRMQLLAGHRKEKGKVIVFFKANRLIKAHSTFSRFIWWFENWREEQSKYLLGRDQWGIWRRLILNEKTNSDQEQILRWSGFVHLYSAAGIHLYALWRWNQIMFISFSFILKKNTQITIFRFCLWLFNWFFVFLIWLLNGFRPGLLRAFLVIFVRKVVKFFGLRVSFYFPLIISIVIDLFFSFLTWDRWDWAPGRCHYALAVGGGLSFIDYYRDSFKKINNPFLRELCFHLALSIGSWIPTALYGLFFERSISWFTPVISLASIPILGTVFYPLVVFLLLFRSEELLFVLDGIDTISGKLVEWLFYLTQYFNQNIMFNSELNIGIIIFSCLIFHLCFLKWFRYGWALGLLIIYFYINTKPIQDRLIQLDVGQGDSALISKNGAWTLLDTGSFWSLRDWDIVLIRAELGVAKIDRVILTHLDEDHFGNLRRWIDLSVVDSVIIHPFFAGQKSNRSMLDYLEKREIRLLPLSQLRPKNNEMFHFFHNKKKKQNGTMLGFEFKFGNWLYVNLGDGSKKIEREYLKGQNFLNDSKCRIIKISHHGSRYSSDKKFIRYFNYAILSSGAGNWYGHPATEVIRRLDQFKVKIHRTDQKGGLEIKASSQCDNG